MKAENVKIPRMRDMPMPKDLYSKIPKFFEGRSLVLLANDGGTRNSLSFYQLPVSRKVNIREVLKTLVTVAVRMKGVEE
jgi:hypothetical protein